MGGVGSKRKEVCPAEVRTISSFYDRCQRNVTAPNSLYGRENNARGVERKATFLYISLGINSETSSAASSFSPARRYTFWRAADVLACSSCCSLVIAPLTREREREREREGGKGNTDFPVFYVLLPRSPIFLFGCYILWKFSKSFSRFFSNECTCEFWFSVYTNVIISRCLSYLDLLIFSCKVWKK